MADGNLETLLRSATFSNPAHKEVLRSRLFDDMRKLEPDELAMVAGGATMPCFTPEDWAEAQENQKRGRKRP